MIADEAAKLGLYCAMGAVGRRHRLRLAVDQLPELGEGGFQAKNSATVIRTGILGSALMQVI